jgi:hypothetical protein
VRRNLEANLSSSSVYTEFRDQLAQALLRVEPAILRVLIEVVCSQLVKLRGSPAIRFLITKVIC